ncbi:DUF6371 domain-containing protein [Corallibacter sp.]|uniref:DUF6371 domain-containing protein n=1 Tax=Corallibacter sp. TaxID=2038084 RepID=UPI003AB89375
MEKTLEILYDKNVIQPYDNVVQNSNTMSYKVNTKQRYIDFTEVEKSCNSLNENNLLLYLRNTFGNTVTNLVKKMYYIGTTKDMGTVFWNINKENRVQKAKISYYKLNGKRTNKFNAPYKNSDGYYSCLYGEHLLNNCKDKAVILVESEKTAIVCAMHFTEYLWLAYGGINGLTESKIHVLKGRKTIIVPDMSENAVSIANKKLTVFKNLGIDANIWDLTEGKKDNTLKKEGLYNFDLEDLISRFTMTNNS